MNSNTSGFYSSPITQGLEAYCTLVKITLSREAISGYILSRRKSRQED